MTTYGVKLVCCFGIHLVFFLKGGKMLSLDRIKAILSNYLSTCSVPHNGQLKCN